MPLAILIGLITVLLAVVFCNTLPVAFITMLFAACKFCPAPKPKATAPAPWSSCPADAPTATALSPCASSPAMPPTATASMP